MHTHQTITVDTANTMARPGARAFPALPRRQWPYVLLALVALVASGRAGAEMLEVDATAPNVVLQRLGKPCFRPVDFHLFSANIENFFALLTGPDGILPEPTHQFHPDLGVGPGEPHDPPYTREVQTGLKRLGLVDQRRFTPEDFRLPKAILFGFMVVPIDQPGCPRGSSPDFVEGPIIPNVLFPASPAPDSVLVSRSTFFRRGEAFDPAFILDVRRLDRITPPLGVDGHSHVPIFLATAAEFGPGGAIEGLYAVHSVLVDHAGNGWDMTARFEIR